MSLKYVHKSGVSGGTAARGRLLLAAARPLSAPREASTDLAGREWWARVVGYELEPRPLLGT